MAFPTTTEGNVTLPVDSNGQSHIGVFDRINHVFRYLTGRANGSLVTAQEKGTPVTTVVVATTSSTSLLAANTARIEAIFYNNDLTNTAYVACGVAATTSKQPIFPGTQWRDTSSTGQWFVITGSSTASVTVTEYS